MGNRSSQRVLLVDDFKPFLQFLCSTLGKKPEIQIVGQASDGLEAVRKAEELRPDFIVLDIGLPSLNGIEAARLIRNVSPNSKILFLSNESSDEVIEEALSVGAWGYIKKIGSGNALLSAVESIISGTAM
jgi:DNA-binding NarL/FixJ family response regulator